MENKYMEQIQLELDFAELSFNNVMSIIDQSLNMPNTCKECGDAPKPDEWSNTDGYCIDCA
jgi:hypothetical protein